MKLTSFYCLLICLFFSEFCVAKDKELLLKEIIDKYSESILKSKNLERRSIGYEWAGPDKVYDGKIHKIVLGYSVDKNLKYKEARQFYYSLVNGLIDEINKHSDLSNCLFRFPVTYKDFWINVRF